MKTDDELKADLVERLDAIPAIDSSEINVLVDNGMVTLHGEVETPQLRFQVERTARRVPGVRSLEMKIQPRQHTIKRHYPER